MGAFGYHDYDHRVASKKSAASKADVSREKYDQAKARLSKQIKDLFGAKLANDESIEKTIRFDREAHDVVYGLFAVAKKSKSNYENTGWIWNQLQKMIKEFELGEYGTTQYGQED